MAKVFCSLKYYMYMCVYSWCNDDDVSHIDSSIYRIGGKWTIHVSCSKAKVQYYKCNKSTMFAITSIKRVTCGLDSWMLRQFRGCLPSCFDSFHHVIYWNQFDMPVKKLLDSRQKVVWIAGFLKDLLNVDVTLHRISWDYETKYAVIHQNGVLTIT